MQNMADISEHVHCNLKRDTMTPLTERLVLCCCVVLSVFPSFLYKEQDDLVI